MAITKDELLAIRDKIIRVRKIADKLLAQDARLTRTEAYSMALEIEDLTTSRKWNL